MQRKPFVGRTGQPPRREGGERAREERRGRGGSMCVCVCVRENRPPMHRPPTQHSLAQFNQTFTPPAYLVHRRSRLSLRAPLKPYIHLRPPAPCLGKRPPPTPKRRLGKACRAAFHPQCLCSEAPCLCHGAHLGKVHDVSVVC